MVELGTHRSYYERVTIKVALRIPKERDFDATNVKKCQNCATLQKGHVIDNYRRGRDEIHYFIFECRTSPHEEKIFTISLHIGQL